MKVFFRSTAHLTRILWHTIISIHFLTVLILGQITIWGASYIFYIVEKGINYNIKHFGDALWWGFTTVTTVGYGDITPVTLEGRVIGVLLMLVGTALFAIHTSLFAEALLSQDYLPYKKVRLEEKHIKVMFERLDEKLDKIESKIKNS
ncbi:MAG: hypothetical protein DRQ88_11855 [Epsilonproteobacteria bacterium]|nr:MAG: hypothetical protein DRQ89_11710 [Campylobacterota bacterium]RLA63853.1 MAG: hypothetical protein DRQ88_11855 [Campylobacterota bacterium]